MDVETMAIDMFEGPFKSVVQDTIHHPSSIRVPQWMELLNPWGLEFPIDPLVWYGI